jgi:hypothetical protein
VTLSGEAGNLEVVMKTNLRHVLGIEQPILAAPMGPDLTGPDLVAAVSNATRRGAADHRAALAGLGTAGVSARIPFSQAGSLGGFSSATALLQQAFCPFRRKHPCAIRL